MTTRAIVVVLALKCWCSRAHRCPAQHGWYINGVRPSGWYELQPVLGRPQDDLLDARLNAWLHRTLPGPEPVRGRIWCRLGGARQDGISVWCEP